MSRWKSGWRTQCRSWGKRVVVERPWAPWYAVRGCECREWVAPVPFADRKFKGPRNFEWTATGRQRRRQRCHFQSKRWGAPDGWWGRHFSWHQQSVAESDSGDRNVLGHCFGAVLRPSGGAKKPKDFGGPSVPRRPVRRALDRLGHWRCGRISTDPFSLARKFRVPSSALDCLANFTHSTSVPRLVVYISLKAPSPRFSLKTVQLG